MREKGLGMGFRVSTRFFLVIFGLTLSVLLVLWATVNQNYAEVLKDNEIKYNLLASDKTKSQFDFTTTLIHNSVSSLGGNLEVRRQLIAVEETDGDQPVDEEARVEIESLLHGILEMQPFLEDIHILSVSDEIAFSSLRSADARGLHNSYGAFFRRALEEDQNEFWSGGYDHAMSYVVPVFRANPRKVVGLIVFNINYDFVREMFMASAIQANERILIVNSDGEIIFNFPHFTAYAPFLEQYPEILESDQLLMEGKVFGQDSIIVSETLNMSDWKIIRLIDMDSITRETRRVSSALRAVLVFGVIASLLCSYALSRAITRPIRVLSEACHRVEQGDLSIQVPITSRDEIGDFSRTFNMMITQVRESFEKGIRDQKRKAEMQFHILQAQINPHFLYNTLDSIKWMAAMQNVNNIAEMSTALIQLLKYNLSRPDAETTLRDEVESVKNYVRIQQFRYSDNFDLTTLLAPETEDCRVLRFMLQPLVENCILHGFEDVDASYRIRIASYLADGCLHVKVIDNGSGMNQQRTREVNALGDKGTRFNENIGVANIRERIHLHFGEEYGLVYSSEPYVGTIAELVLPVQYPEGDPEPGNGAGRVEEQMAGEGKGP